MKTYRALALTTLAAAAFFLFAACDNGMDAPRQEDGLARIRIGLAATDGRSVLPTAPSLEDMEWFSLYGIAPDQTESNWLADFVYTNGAFCDRNNGAEAVVYVNPGTWRFTLSAYPPGRDVAALKGSETVTVAAGFSGTVNFTLSLYAEEGNAGSVSIFIELPEGSDVASVETSIDGEPLDPPLAVEAGAVIYENDETPVGQYMFSFVLKDSAGETVAVVSDIVIVTTGAESAKRYILTDEDINGPPAAPSDLAIESYDDESQTFHFTWQDNSFNETGFTLFDGTTIHTIGAATQSFDLSISAAPATYTLKAVNAFGESAGVQLAVFAVTFDADGGDPTTLTRPVASGGSVGSSNMPSEPGRDGYAFVGWYTARNGGGSPFTDSTPVTGNTTVYAKWMTPSADPVMYQFTQNAEFNNYIIQPDDFLPDGFAVRAGDQIEISFLIKTEIAMENFGVGIADWSNGGDWIAEGWGASKDIAADGRFHWRSWTLTAQGSGPAGAVPLAIQFSMNSVSEPQVTVYISDVTIINHSSYTVTFDADGGTPATQWRAVNSGGSVGASNMPSEPTRDYYAFDGWYTAQNGGGSPFTFSNTVLVNRTVYAKWIEADISNITYSPVSGGEWALQSDRSRKSPVTGDSGIAQTRVSFTAKADASITILLRVSSEPEYDWAFVSELDNASVIPESGYYANNKISGETSVTITIPVPTAGRHFIDIGYRKDIRLSIGSDCAWFTVASNAPSNLSLAESLAWISDNAVEGGAYTITLKNDETIPPKPLSSYDDKNISIILEGGASERTVSLSTTGTLFTVVRGVTLTLGNNVTLRGRSNNTPSLVIVDSGGALAMNAGSKITGNYAPEGGGGVLVYDGGAFTMNGGEISGNSADFGGGVLVYGGAFTMNGGEISGNSAPEGGGVFCVDGGAFTMNGGTISGNSAPEGGGVEVGGSGIFSMSGGTISGNTAYAGGGVDVYGDEEGDGTFTMSGGTISGNSADYGGGVYVYGGMFVKQSGGVIYGSNASDTLKNTATNGNSYGHAVFVDSSPAKIRNTTAGAGVTLDSGVRGSSGGWE